MSSGLHDDDHQVQVDVGDVDDLVTSLRQPPRADELLGEAAAVARIVEVLTAPDRGIAQSPPVSPPSRSRLTALAAVAVVVIGLIALAAVNTISAPGSPTKITVVPSGDTTAV